MHSDAQSMFLECAICGTPRQQAAAAAAAKEIHAAGPVSNRANDEQPQVTCVTLSPGAATEEAPGAQLLELFRQRKTISSADFEVRRSAIMSQARAATATGVPCVYTAVGHGVESTAAAGSATVNSQPQV